MSTKLVDEHGFKTQVSDSDLERINVAAEMKKIWRAWPLFQFNICIPYPTVCIDILIWFASKLNSIFTLNPNFIKILINFRVPGILARASSRRSTRTRVPSRHG